MRARLTACPLLLVLALAGAPAAALDFAVKQYASVEMTVARVEPGKDQLRLFWRDQAERPFHSFGALSAWLGARRQKLRFAMNAGMYEPDYSPVGLFVADAHTLAPLNLYNSFGNFYLKPNGVFFIGPQGAGVLETQEFKDSQRAPTLATQSGPMLVRRGAIHPAFLPTSSSRLIRNGVGVTSKGEVVFAISEGPVNFHDFATFFRDVLDCPDALYLDGSISSLFAPELGRNDARAALGPIIGVVENTQP